MLQLRPEDVPGVLLQPELPLKVPRELVGRMARGDATDPLLRQVLPLNSELQRSGEFSADPLQERRCSPVPCLLHKYHGRALLLASDRCAIQCRFCFRRHFPFDQHRPSEEQLRRALDHVGNDTGIEELILSGGDPLTLAPARLEQLCQTLAQIPHLRRLRFHTRLPVVAPGQMPDRLARMLADLPLATVMVIHANHSRELGRSTRRVLEPLADAGVTLLNQSVLLRGVNDELAILQGLSEALFDLGVLPYYLHMLDPVQGTAHFAVPRDRALDLVRCLAAGLPGYLVPRLVREQPGAESKVPVSQAT